MSIQICRQIRLVSFRAETALDDLDDDPQQ